MAFKWFGRKNHPPTDSRAPSMEVKSFHSFGDGVGNTLKMPASSSATPVYARGVKGRHVARSGSSSEIYKAPSVPRPFKTSRLVGEYEKPWLEDRYYSKRERADKYILGGSALIGVAITFYFCYTSWMSLTTYDYCLILDDDFSTFNQSTWSHEVGVGGYGYGSFDWTTDDPLNSYIASDGLHIVPTLTLNVTNITPAQMLNNFTLNLTADGTCTSPAARQCVIISNTTNGTVINPVRSARLTTAGKVSIKYGKVEVVAKFPKGDWLWPSIWMYPEKETYGIWPRSGEIDIAFARGNAPTVTGNGRDTVTSTMHWGASGPLDQSDRTTGNMTIRRNDLSEGFHTFGLEWSEDHLFTWIDDRVVQPLSTTFGKALGNMYDRAEYATHWVLNNGTYVKPVDAWSQTGRYNTPFDQPFHLIINVAVGAQNGWFDNSQGDKPWVDLSGSAMRSFWQSQSSWLPSWGEGADSGMTVKSVKMWQQGKC